MPRDVDIDGLLDAGGLNFRLGGKQYELRDVPLKTLLEAQQAQDESNDPRDLLKRLMPALAENGVLDDIGARAAGVMLREITGFFAREAELAEAPATAPAEASVGSTPSPDSSGTTPAIS